MLANFTDRAWLWVAAGLYLAGFAVGTITLLRKSGPAGGVTYALIAIGYFIQLAGLGIRGRAIGGCPLGNQFEIYQFTAWSAITLYLVVGVTFRKSLLGYFTSMLAASLTIVSLAIPSWDGPQRVRFFGNNPWIELHAALAVFSYGVFGLLALTSIMSLLRNHSLKSKHLGGWFSFLPSIRDLDQIGVRLLGAGVTILAVSLCVGANYWLRDVASVNSAKLLATVAIWLAYTVTFGQRLRGRLLANRFAWVCLGMYAAALVSLVPVDRNRPTPPATQEKRLP